MERELAKCLGFDIVDDDHGGLMLGGVFLYEGGSRQGLGYQIDIEFIRRFMQVFGAQSLQEVNGQSCWVTHSHEGIHKIAPLHKDDGEAFDINKWGPRKKYLAQKKKAEKTESRT